jgi:YVTN family beta-propeller protein
VLTRVSVLLVAVMFAVSSKLPDAKPAPLASGILVVANQKEHTLLLIDPDARRELAKIVVGVNGHEVMTSKDGRFAYVPIYGNSGVGKPGTDGSTIDVIDLHERKLVSTIDLGKPLRPHRAEVGPDGLLYVTAELANAVDVIDPATKKVLAEIPTGAPQAHMLILSPDGLRGYTANVSAGSVSVLDLEKRTLVTTIPVAKIVQRLAISTDGKRVFTHDQDSPRIAVIDTATNKVASWIELPAVAYGSAPTPDGRWLLSVSMSADHLFVIDLQTLKVVRTLDVAKGSSEVLVRPDGEFAYVSGTGGGKIAVADLRTWKMLEPIELTPGVDGLSWATAPM